VTACTFCYSLVSAIAGLELVVEMLCHDLLTAEVWIGDMSRRETGLTGYAPLAGNVDEAFTATVVLGAAFRRALLRLMRMHDTAVSRCDR
jgi:hypothetical protein